jgi:hypothetical protein
VRWGARTGIGACLAVFPLAVVTPGRVAPAQGQTVFINEIHCDNEGTDAGEAIEIAGPAYDTTALLEVPAPRSWSSAT